MTAESNTPRPVPPLPDIVPASPSRAVEPPPLPVVKKPGFFQRLFTSRRKQQAIQNGYTEIVDLVRSIRSHLDRQEVVQTRVLQMIEKVPDTLEQQHEIMTLFQQQLETGVEHDRRLTDSMDHLTTTLTAMDESHRGASRTIADLIGRSRETEQLLREVMRRAERRMAILLALVVIGVAGAAFALYHKVGAMTPVPEVKPIPVAEAKTTMAPISQPVVEEKETTEQVPLLSKVEESKPEETSSKMIFPVTKSAKKKSKRTVTPAVNNDAQEVKNAMEEALAEEPVAPIESPHTP